jgi:sugar/nucleoside kinase (ribokinase family)
VFTGLSTLDVVHPVAEPPAVGRKAQAGGQWLAAGGPAANAAVVYATLVRLAGRPAGPIRLLTALGRHPLAGYVAAELRSHGVTVLDATPNRTDPPPVSSAWLTPDGARTVVSANAADIDAPPPPDLAAIMAGSAVLLVDGHHPRLALAAVRAARDAAVPVLLDGGSWKPVLAAVLPLVDLAACSADFRAPGTGSIEEAARCLVEDYRVPAVAFTDGAAPIRWFVRGAAGRLPVPAVTAVDTLGAGDAFHGALAWAVATRRDVTAALGFAAGVAAVRCATAGPRAWLADPRLPALAAGWLTVSPRSLRERRPT